VRGWYLIIIKVGYQPSVIHWNDVASPGAAVSHLALRAGQLTGPGWLPRSCPLALAACPAREGTLAA